MPSSRNFLAHSTVLTNIDVLLTLSISSLLFTLLVLLVYDVPRALLLFAHLHGLFAHLRFEISDL